MTLVTNIKGYINDKEWGVYEPPHQYLTYQQLTDTNGTLTQQEVLTELNTYPEYYYTYLNSQELYTEINGHALPMNIIGYAQSQASFFDYSIHSLVPQGGIEAGRRQLVEGVQRNGTSFVAVSMP